MCLYFECPGGAITSPLDLVIPTAERGKEDHYFYFDRLVSQRAVNGQLLLPGIHLLGAEGGGGGYHQEGTACDLMTEAQ